MRRFFYRIERRAQGLPLSPPQPRRGFNKLNGGKLFSKIDLSKANLHIPGEENNSKLLCINTQRAVQIRQTSFWNESRTGYLPTGDCHHARRH